MKAPVRNVFASFRVFRGSSLSVRSFRAFRGSLLSCLEFEGGDVFDVSGLASAEQGHDDGETDRNFGGGYGDDEEDKHLGVVVTGPVRLDLETGKGDQGQISRIQHQLEAH